MDRQLPTGWAWATLGELTENLDRQRKPISATVRASRPGSIPYYGASGQVGTIDEALFDDELLLLGEDGVQFFDPNKTKAYLIQGKSWVNNHAHVLRAGPATSNRFLLHYLNQFNYEGFANGTTRLKLTKLAASSIPVILPPLPEQHRIVEVLEDHFSRLDAAEGGVAQVHKRTTTFVRRLIASRVGLPWSKNWDIRTVSESGKVDLGRQRHPDWHHGDDMRPYLRVANVFEDRLDLSDVMEMNFPPDVFTRFRLSPGDILLNEGQSPHLLGRPAMYRGYPADMAFTNSLIRFRANPDVLPEWALMVFRHYMHSGRFTKETRITTNIAHLSSNRFKTIEFPVPSLTEQQSILTALNVELEQATRLIKALPQLKSRSTGLRKSLLRAAFNGELVDQDSTDEPAEIALARLRAEAPAKPARGRTKSVPAL